MLAAVAGYVVNLLFVGVYGSLQDRHEPDADPARDPCGGSSASSC